MLGLSDLMKEKFSWLLISFLLYSCSNSPLTVQTDYLSHKDLASYYVDTPDPRQNFPTIGQRLIVSWSIPKSYLAYENLHLCVTIRFRNREEVIEIFDILQTRGTYVFTLLNNDFIAKKGILTYKVDLIGSGLILAEWRHKIWTDLILIHHEDDSVMQDVKKDLEEYEDEYPIDWHDEAL